MKKIAFALVVASLFSIAAQRAHAAAAIALNPSNPGQSAISYNNANQNEANSAALSRCGNGCQIALEFSDSCGAIAIDKSSGSTIYATAYAGGPDQAGQIAVSSCISQGGGQCYRSGFACDRGR